MIKNFINIFSHELLNTIFCSLIGIKISKFKKGDSVSAMHINEKTKGFIETVQYPNNRPILIGGNDNNNEEFLYVIKTKSDYIISFRESQICSCRINLIEKIQKE